MTVVESSGSGSASVVRLGRFSVLVHPRTMVVCGGLAVLVVLLALTGIAIGTRWIPLHEVVGGLIGQGDRSTTLIVQRFRAPRVVVAVLVGAALGISGAVVQAVTRNPIAAPDVIGVTAGASFGAVATLLLLGSAGHGYGGATAELSEVGLPVGAIAGALVAATIVLWVGGMPGPGAGLTFSPRRVVLVGIVCHAAFMGLVHWGLAAGDVDQAGKAAVWLVGSLHGRGWEHAAGVGLVLALLLPLLLFTGRRLGVLALGESSAGSLGVPVARTQLGMFGMAFVLAGAAAAAAGPVDFVALLAPQIVRRLMPRAGVSLLASALAGAALLLAADLIARLIIPGIELPAGAVTALVGAPYLLWLVVRMGGRR